MPQKKLKSMPEVKFHPACIELAKSIGDFMQYWGFSRTDGQIWCLVFLAQQPLSGQVLAKALGLSKASVSLAIQELTFYEVIEPVARGEGRTIFYRSNPDIEQVIVNILKNRELDLVEKCSKAIDHVRQAEKTHPQCFPIINHEKLGELESMVQHALAFLNILISTKLHMKMGEFEEPS